MDDGYVEGEIGERLVGLGLVIIGLGVRMFLRVGYCSLRFGYMFVYLVVCFRRIEYIGNFLGFFKKVSG